MTSRGSVTLRQQTLNADVVQAELGQILKPLSDLKTTWIGLNPTIRAGFKTASCW